MLESLESEGLLRRPIIPEDCQHNAHMYYVLLSPGVDRQEVLKEMKFNEVGAVFHYVPLHSSPAGLKFGRAHGDMKNTNELSERLIRLPLWVGMTEAQQDKVFKAIHTGIHKQGYALAI